MTLTGVSLFAGVGGFDLAMQGHAVVRQSSVAVPVLEWVMSQLVAVDQAAESESAA